MASSVWKGTLTFGLLAIPIKLYTAARSQRINLHQLHKVCHTRLKQPLFCPHCNRQVDRSEVVKGYEYEKGQYVIVTDEELKKITPRSSTVMELVAFVKQDQIDPIYFDASYFMLPDKEAEKPYALLLKTLEDSGRVGIATVTMHQREYTVVVRPHADGLLLHTMFYPEEVREVPEFRRDQNVSVKPQEVALAEKLVEGLATDFDPSKYHDEYQGRLLQMIEAKREGQAVASEAPKKRAPVIDLMQALQKSLGELPARKPAAKAAPVEPEETAAPPAKKQPRRKTATG